MSGVKRPPVPECARQPYAGILNLNLNLHAHSLLADGVFVPQDDGPLAFHILPPPTDDDVEAITLKVRDRCKRLLMKLADERDLDDADDESAALNAALAEALNPPVTLPMFGNEFWEHPAKRKARCSLIEGYSIHANALLKKSSSLDLFSGVNEHGPKPSAVNVAVASDDRKGLARLCRYGLRSSFALSRLSLTDDGQVRYEFKKPWPHPGGITALTRRPRGLPQKACLPCSAPAQSPRQVPWTMPTSA